MSIDRVQRPPSPRSIDNFRGEVAHEGAIPTSGLNDLETKFAAEKKKKKNERDERIGPSSRFVWTARVPAKAVFQIESPDIGRRVSGKKVNPLEKGVRCCARA